MRSDCDPLPFAAAPCPHLGHAMCLKFARVKRCDARVPSCHKSVIPAWGSVERATAAQGRRSAVGDGLIKQMYAEVLPRRTSMMGPDGRPVADAGQQP